ncbi:hypothetical protein, partial [Verminephrobacter aporrectodeae]
AATIFNQTGHLALNGTSVHATGTSGASGLDDVSGQISVESGGSMEIDAHSLLASRTDLSMIKGLGDFNIGPLIATASHNLTMITRNGNINLTGSAGTSGMGSSRRVVAYVNGDLTLVANNILLEGSYLRAVHGTLNLTATTGNITATALRASKTEAGFLSKTEDNRSRPDGWFEDEKFLRPSTINGSTGVNIGAQGGNLVLSATSVHAANGKASLQASGHINLEAAQKHRLRRYLASTTAYIGSNVQTVSSTLAAREDITLASVAGDASGRVDVVASGLNAGGQVRLLANDMVFITAGTNTLDGVASPARSGITARQLIQAETVRPTPRASAPTATRAARRNPATSPSRPSAISSWTRTPASPANSAAWAKLKGGGEVIGVVLSTGQVQAVKVIITAPKAVNWGRPPNCCAESLLKNT